MTKLNDKWEIKTKLVGVASGSDAEDKQFALQTIKENWDDRKRWYVHLIPDPDNPYDRDALRVLAEVPNLGRVFLGHISNSEYKCEFCGKEYQKNPVKKDDNPKQCPTCGAEKLVRNGLATTINHVIRQNPQENIYGEILQITGGEDGRPTLGCNIVVRKAYKRDK